MGEKHHLLKHGLANYDGLCLISKINHFRNNWHSKQFFKYFQILVYIGFYQFFFNNNNYKKKYIFFSSHFKHIFKHLYIVLSMKWKVWTSSLAPHFVKFKKIEGLKCIISWKVNTYISNSKVLVMFKLPHIFVFVTWFI